MKRVSCEALCFVYAAAMASVYLLVFGPGGYLSISETKKVAFYALTGLFLAGMAGLVVLRKDKPRRRPGPAQYLVGLYWLATLVSAVCSPWRETAFLGAWREEGVVTISLYCAVFWALSLYAKPDRRLIYLFAGALAVNCVVCALQLTDGNPLWLFPGALRWSGRGEAYSGAFLGLTGNADLGAAVLCLGFPACWVYALRARKPLFWVPAALCLAVLVGMEVRGGLLGALGGSVLALPVALPLSGKKRKRMYLWLGVLLLALALGVWLLPLGGLWGEAHALLRGQADDSLGSGRVYIWRNTLALVPQRLLLGGGADTLGLRLEAAFTRVQADGTVLRRAIDCAHNEYLNILVNQGLVALVSYLAALACSLCGFLRTRKTAAAVMGAAVLCYCIQAFFGISMPANAGLYWCMWGLLEAALGEGQTMVRSFHLPLR